MRSIKNLLPVSVMIISGLIIFSHSLSAQPKPWIVPAEYKTMINPVAKGDVSNKTGQAMYNKYCAACHGKTGLGDGVKSRVLREFSGDLSSPVYQNETDGEQFYKTKFGRGEMPRYEGRCTDEEIWNMVNYMRTFKK